MAGKRSALPPAPPVIRIESLDVPDTVRGPFNVAAPAQAAGVAAMEDQDYVAWSRAENTRVLESFSAAVTGLGLTVVPSVGNFVLVRFAGEPGRDAAAAAAHLKRHGILARGVAPYGLADSLRITIGTEADMTAVADALREFAA